MPRPSSHHFNPHRWCSGNRHIRNTVQTSGFRPGTELARDVPSASSGMRCLKPLCRTQPPACRHIGCRPNDKDPGVSPGSLSLWAKGDLNPHVPKGHWHLKPARLPFRHSPECWSLRNFMKYSTRAILVGKFPVHDPLSTAGTGSGQVHRRPVGLLSHPTGHLYWAKTLRGQILFTSRGTGRGTEHRRHPVDATSFPSTDLSPSTRCPGNRSTPVGDSRHTEEGGNDV